MLDFYLDRCFALYRVVWKEEKVGAGFCSWFNLALALGGISFLPISLVNSNLTDLSDGN